MSLRRRLAQLLEYLSFESLKLQCLFSRKPFLNSPAQKSEMSQYRATGLSDTLHKKAKTWTVTAAKSILVGTLIVADGAQQKGGKDA